MANLADNIVWGDGVLPNSIIFIGERPGKVEAQRQLPFVGPAGEFFNFLLAVAGLSREDVYVTNLCKSFDGYRKPTEAEIDSWLPVLHQEIADADPSYIVLLGTYAVEAVMSGWWRPARLTKRHGRAVRLPSSGVVTIASYHPAYGLYEESKKDELIADFETMGQIFRGEVDVPWLEEECES